MDFALPEQTGRADTTHYQALSNKLERLAHTAGANSDAFRKRKEYIHARLHAGKRIQEVIQTPRDIRPLLEVWQACDECIDRNPIDHATLKHFTALRQRHSLLVLFAFSQLFFDRFDELGGTQAFAAFIRAQFRLNAERKFSQTLARLAKQSGTLFTIHGPARVVEQARKDDLPLETVAERLGLPMEREGRFFTQCKNIYYLDTLRGLQIGQSHEILSELAQKDTYKSAYEGGWLLGHKVIQVMVDKAAGHQKLPDNWLRVILAIAGDPRVSKRASNYVKWWARLGNEYIQQVRQWLSWMDIGLFLEILEDYASNSGDFEMERMFPARKRFLKGVFEKGLITDSRLFLSRRAEGYIRRHYRENDIPAYSRVNDSSRSVIYLKIDGNYVIEGTHNFYFWIYRQLPRANPIEDYERSEFPIRDLGMGLKERYESKFGYKGVINITHLPNWQRKAIDAFRELGTDVDPSDVLDSEDYRAYRRRYGVVWPRSAANP